MKTGNNGNVLRVELPIKCNTLQPLSKCIYAILSKMFSEKYKTTE